MSQFKEDTMRLQTIVATAFQKTGALVAMAEMIDEKVQVDPYKMQRTFEDMMVTFEQSVLEARQLCERYMKNIPDHRKRKALLAEEVVGEVSLLEGKWLHITLRTLLPHCYYRPALWLMSTIRQLLDDYENRGNPLPFYHNALLVIEEHSDVQARHVFDQDNKGWKVISNAIKGRLIPDDDQYTLGVTMLSKRSQENCCHIVLLDRADTLDFFSKRSEKGSLQGFYKPMNP